MARELVQWIGLLSCMTQTQVHILKFSMIQNIPEYKASKPGSKIASCKNTPQKKSKPKTL